MESKLLYGNDLPGMEKMSSRKQKSSLKGKEKERKKQIKVVYISNPMRVEASASEFKGIVQELTGQDSDISDLTKFADSSPEKPAGGDFRQEQQRQEPTESYDEIFSHQVLEDLSGFMASGPFYLPSSSSFDGSQGRKNNGK